MSYFKILGFEKEPFSTSPDPEFFYLSKEHEIALSNTLIELRLKRGLSVILGDIGTGKTSLSRKLIQELKQRDDFIFHMVLDPTFENDQQFLFSLAKNFEINLVKNNAALPSIADLREGSLEVLRVLLNYETNEFKLLQLVLPGQLELHSKIMNIPNFFDRISFKYTLNPLDFNEAKEMIEFRIVQAGYRAGMHLFLDDGIREIYQHAKGYPRQITMLCHKALKTLVLKNRFAVDAKLVRELADEEIKSGWHRRDPLLERSSINV